MPSDPRAPAEPDHEPPQIDGAVGGPPKLVVHMDFDSHIDHAVVGLMDPIHVPYIHNQWWWRSAKKQHEKAKAFAPRPFGFAMTRHKPSSNSRAYRLLGGAPETEITFRLPGQRWEHVRYGQRTFMTLTCMTPLDERRTRMTQLFWSDLPLFGLLKPLVRRAAKTFLSQDVGILGLQSEGLSHDPSLIWIEDADTQAKWYGQLKREWTAHRREGREFRNPVPETVLRWRS
jgi:phenylpropionate dioxygenase-like ring-hydroxylating dioxygenase large terminal subunit